MFGRMKTWYQDKQDEAVMLLLLCLLASLLEPYSVAHTAAESELFANIDQASGENR